MEINKWLDNPNLYGFGCVLQAYGKDFEPTLFLNETNFNSKLIIFKGKIDFPEGFKNEVAKYDPPSRETFGHTYLVLRISESETSTVQVEEAALFLRKHRNEILRLSNFSNVEQVILQFKGLKDEYENLPSELESLAFSSGIKTIFW